jgi:hypothetical protein
MPKEISHEFICGEQIPAVAPLHHHPIRLLAWLRRSVSRLRLKGRFGLFC